MPARAWLAAVLSALLGVGALGLAPASAATRPGSPPPRWPENPLARQAWFDAQRAGPSGTVPAGAYARAVTQARALATAAPRATPGPAGALPQPGAQWVNLGPSPLLGAEASGTGASGRVSSIAIAPGGTIYVGSAGGGLWSSSDGGTSWSPLTDRQPSLALGAVAVDPGNPDILYAGTGEAHQSVDSFYGLGLLKSGDGGKTWQVLGADVFGGHHISAVVINPADDQMVYVAGTMGLYESTDGGATWTERIAPASSYGVSDLKLVPGAAGCTMYAAVPGAGIYVSSNGCADWSGPLASQPVAAGLMGNTALGLAPPVAGEVTVYASIADASGGLVGLYKSLDGGVTWKQLTSVPDYFSAQYFYGPKGGALEQGWYDNVVAVDPLQPDTVVAGGIALVESTDGGANWHQIGLSAAGNPVIHPDQHALVFDSSGDLLIGNDGGVWEVPATDLSQATGSYSPLNLNANLSITQMYPGMAVYGDGSEILAGAQDVGTGQYSGGTGTWSELLTGDGTMTAIDPADPAIVYAEEPQGGLYRIQGSVATSIAPPATTTPAWVAPFALVPSDPSTIYFGAGNVWKTQDATAGAPAWQRLNDSPPAAGGVVSALAVAPSNPQVVYAGWSTGAVEMSADGGSTWRAISPGPGRWVTDIAVSPTDPYTAYVTMSGYQFPQYGESAPHVFATSDADAVIPAWSDISGNLPDAPVNALVVDGAELIAASDVGVFVTTDGGANWRALGSGLPNVQVVGLRLAPDGALFAGTHGRGVWMISAAAPAAAATSVTGVQPASEPVGSPSSVTITGTGFTGATAVDFGALPAAGFTVVSDTEITATPPDGGGVVDVTVTAGGATSAAVAADRFTYTGSPDLASLGLSAAPVGTQLTLSGSGFGATVAGAVYFFPSTGQALPASPTSWSDTGAAVAVPKLTAGRVLVAVRNATTGELSDRLPLQVTAGPALVALSPASAAAGGTLTLSGAGFGSVAGAVYLAQGSLKVPAALAAPWSSTRLQVTVPAGFAAGTVSVAVYGEALGFSNALPLALTGTAGAGGGSGGGSPGGGTSGGATGGGSGGSSSSKANSPTQQTDTAVTEQVDTGAQAVTVQTSDASIALTFARGSLPAGTTVGIAEATGAPPPPPGLALASPAWQIDAGAATLASAAGLTIRYHLPAGVSAGQLALYTVRGGRWVFAGAGAPDPGRTTLSGAIPDLGTWAVMAYLPTYTDVPAGYWAFRDIEVLSAQGAAAGYPGGAFRPAGTVTRAEFVKLLLGVLGIPPREAAAQPFGDVAAGAWYAGYVDAAAAAGILQGSGGLARPDAAVSRQEAAVMLMRAVSLRHLGRLGTAPAHPPVFADQAAIASWAARPIALGVELGLIHGYPDGTFRPLATLSRAEAAALVAELARLAGAQGPAPS